MFKHILLAGLAFTGHILAAPSNVQRQLYGETFTWGSTKIRGVNLGGWLVLEPWITPSIFENVDQSLGIIDEYTLSARLPAEAPALLRQHWDTWITFADFQRIAAAGLNVVRLPVGYWAFNNSGSPFVAGAAEYVDRALAWARQTSPPLRVVIDLHGAPGSQNGFDNSGQMRRPEEIGWLQGGVEGETARQTLGVIRLIAERYATAEWADVVVGVELLNEPMGWRLSFDQLKEFYRRGFQIVREVGSTTVVLQDAFMHPGSYNGFLTPQDGGAHGVAVDHHYYQIFSEGEASRTPWQQRQAVCNGVSSYAGADKWTFIGEWSGAMTDCAGYLNGYKVGARTDGTYPNTGYHASCAKWRDMSAWTAEDRQDMRLFIEAQIDAFEAHTQGWFFWTLKTERAPEWDLLRLLDEGIFPRVPDERLYPRVCTEFH